MGESEKEYDPNRMLNRDAILLAVLAGLSYYFVYSFQKNFLGYFGFSAIFIEVTLSKILFSVGVVIGAVVVVYLLAAVFPIRFLRPLFLLGADNIFGGTYLLRLYIFRLQLDTLHPCGTFSVQAVYRSEGNYPWL